MIEDVELSPNNRARCIKCSEKIKKDTPRGRTHTGHFVCTNCFESYLQGMILKIDYMEKEFAKLRKQTNVR